MKGGNTNAREESAQESSEEGSGQKGRQEGEEITKVLPAWRRHYTEKGARIGGRPFCFRFRLTAQRGRAISALMQTVPEAPHALPQMFGG